MSTTLLGCAGPADPQERAPVGRFGGPEDDAGAAGEGPQEGADQLLAEARAALSQGELPEDVRARIVASSDPAHARARRILLAMEGDLPSEVISVGAEGDADDPDTAAPTLRPPTDPAPASAPKDPTPKPASGATAPPNTAKPAIAMVTSLALMDKKGAVELVIRGAAPIEVGKVTQLESGTLRYVLPSTGALPSALSARPRVGGVAVTDVRRGEGTVQLAIELDAGWKAQQPRKTESGAKIRFVRG